MPDTFKTWFDYEAVFSRAVKGKFRYIHNKGTKDFLDTVLATSKNRETSVSAGTVCWRAQLGSAKTEGVRYQGKTLFRKDIPYPAERMKPAVDRAKEGRANPKGIPCLYLATEMQTAIQEIRPWCGSLVSVARFETVRDLKVVDCSKNVHALDGSSFHSLFPVGVDVGELTGSQIEAYVWSWIDSAFSGPVDPSDEKGDYVPTQILAELFKANGYDGVIYNSLFSGGKNVALFDLDSGKQTDCKLYRITKIPPFEFRESKS